MTTTYKTHTKIKKDWYLVDAKNVVLGRLATRVATILMGKHKPIYTPAYDTGDFVIVINSELVKLSGQKTSTKGYYRYSGYPGGYKEVRFTEMIKSRPDRVIREAVRKMLPKRAQGRHMLRKLKVYRGDKHPHQAQTPQKLDLNNFRKGRIWLTISGQQEDASQRAQG